MARGRKSKNVDFMKTLMDVFGYTNASSFAKACGKKTSNMSRYLRGTLQPGNSVLKTAMTHLGEWPVQPLSELQPIPSKINSLPTAPGLYFLFDSGGKVLYLGKATNLRTEVCQTLHRTVPVSIRLSPHLKKNSYPTLKTLATHMSLYAVREPLNNSSAMR